MSDLRFYLVYCFRFSLLLVKSVAYWVAGKELR